MRAGLLLNLKEGIRRGKGGILADKPNSCGNSKSSKTDFSTEPVLHRLNLWDCRDLNPYAKSTARFCIPG